MHPIYWLLLYFFTLASWATEHLKFEKIIFNRDDTEISGLLYQNDHLLFVADKLSNRAIYKIKMENDRFFYKTYIDLSQLQGHTQYFSQALLFRHAGRIIKSPFDLEGIASCDNDYYLANEQTRHILKVNTNEMKKLEIDFSNIFKKFGHPLEEIETNAGFEGLAIDCENQILYIAQERQPRAIIVVDIKKMIPIDIFVTPGKGVGKVNPDYADLYFENGYLYILERNFHHILKVDPKTKKVVKKFAYGETNHLHLKEIYQTKEPYGLAEGLAMSKDQIFIGIDNNKNQISEKAQKAFGLKGKFSSLLIYTRPKDF